MSEPPEAMPRRSRLLNPWLLGALGGMALVTLMRPLMVRRPEPPPPRAELPAFLFSDQHGRPFGVERVAGRIWVAALVDPRGDGAAARTLEALLELQARYQEVEAPVALVALALDDEALPGEARRRLGVEGGADFSRLALVGGPPEVTCAFAVPAFHHVVDGPRPGCEGLADIAGRGRLLLVDGSRRSRGLYESTAVGIDEVFHRSLHVLREERRSAP